MTPAHSHSENWVVQQKGFNRPPEQSLEGHDQKEAAFKAEGIIKVARSSRACLEEEVVHLQYQYDRKWLIGG